MEHHHLILGFLVRHISGRPKRDNALAQSCINICGACPFQAAERRVRGFLGPAGSIFNAFMTIYLRQQTELAPLQ